MSIEWLALIAVTALVVGNFIYCAIAIRGHLAQGRSRLAIFGLVVALGPVLPLVWCIYILSEFTT